MSAISFALIFALTTVLMAEFVNGWTDAPNVIATVVARRDVAESRHPDGGNNEYGRRHVRHRGRGNRRQGDHRSRRHDASRRSPLRC